MRTLRHVSLMDFCKRVTVVSAAVLGVAGVLSIMWSAAAAYLIAPIVAKQVETVAKQTEEGDRRLASQLRRLSRDRIEIIGILEVPAGGARVRAVNELKRQWRAEALADEDQ